MYTVQLAVGNAPYGALLCDLLAHTESCHVQAVDKPDPRQSGVMVVNEKTLDRMPKPIERPERVVLITPKEPERLASAWEAGIRCVVFDSDPPRTMALAVMGAALRVRTPNVPAGPLEMPHPPRDGNVHRVKTH
ncbi:MAG: hypothetical protein LAP39_30820 [Acidobacteriia bacterium]|nr:hypothetical protein [Terriglobia bacterium]